MKKRRLVISLFLIATVAFLGIGYSALTKELKVTGRLDAVKNNENLNVHYVAEKFTVVKNPADSATIVATPSLTSELVANIVVSGMTEIGEKVTVYYMIQNNSDATEALDATLSLPYVSVTANSASAIDDNAAKDVFEGDHFKIAASYVTTDGNETATGSVSEGVASIKAPVADNELTTDVNETADGQTIWLKVEVELIDVITVDSFPTHNIQIIFNASTK